MEKYFEKIRAERGLSVSEVEQAAGLPHDSLLGIESGKHQTAHGLYKLAQYYGVGLTKIILLEYGLITTKTKHQ